MTDERKAIHELRLQLTALLEHSDAAPGTQAIACLMAAAWACRSTAMPPDVAAALLAGYYRRDPLA
jgi:hypothetical protein